MLKLTPRFIVFTGLLLRLLIIPFTLNWDLWASTKLVNDFKWGNLGSFYKNPLAVYPPLTYFTLKSSLTIIHPFTGDSINSWLEKGDVTALTSPYLYRYLFLIKIPYLLFEIATGYVFVRLFKQRQRLYAYLLWWWNPVIIFLVSAWANVDIIALFFVVAALKAHQNKRLIFASSLLSIGISYKLFPVFLIPFTLMTILKAKRVFAACLISLGIVSLTHLPIISSVGTYLNHAIIGGYRDLVLFSIFPIGPNRALITVYFFYFLLIFFFFQIRKEIRNSLVVKYDFLILAVIFAFSKFGLQWFIWIIPFLNIIILNSRNLRPMAILVYFLYFTMVIFSQTSLNIGMLGPLEPSFWRLDYPLKNILGERHLDTIFNSIHTLFATTLLFIGYRWLKNKTVIKI